ncbi:MAG: two-component system response regulator [Zoogloeaceae bacterium]|jgi:putative two-component system response regulator|nr:two-component system response regulator [Zoogloeaceae bacterium]
MINDLASQKQTVLIVDDAPENLTLISNLLRERYKVKIATNGAKALEIAHSVTPPDLILLDVLMPGMDGYEVCRALKDDPKTAAIPVIFLTANYDNEDEQYGFELGAIDYIIKPVVSAILLARVETHMQLKLSADFLRDKSEYLEAQVALRTAEIQEVQDATILMMASLAETRDNETGKHIQRTQHYMHLFARHLRSHPRFRDYMTDSVINILYKSAPLHDIGKIGIPDRILLKPGKLTPEEFEIMKTHTTLGYDAIEHAEKQLGSKVEFLAYAKEIAYCHHEKWDGSGYPQGLSGEDIPICARLMAVADVYDALTSRRVYKPPMPHDAARGIIVEGRGKHFDPDVVDAFLELEDACLEIARRFTDSDGALLQKAERAEFALSEENAPKP